MAGHSSKLVRPRAGRLTRRGRRAAIIAAALVIGGLLGAQLFAVPPGSLAASVLKLATALLTVGGFALVMTRSLIWFMGNAPDEALDERELSLRNRSYFRAYAIYAGLTVLAGFYFLDLAPDFGLWMPTHYDQWWALVWAYLILALGAPAAFLAWDEGDPETESLN